MRVLAAAVIAGAALTAPDRVPAAGGDIAITPILHSSVQVEHAGLVIQVDPWSAADLASAKKADLILVTDTVAHHLDPKAIGQLRKPGAPVIIPAAAKAKVPDGVVLPNGERTMAAGVLVESIAAYDLTPGEPYHPKGEANGYVITLGGKRLFFAGVTECVPEVRAVKNVDVVFMPMLLPLERMTPAAAAACVKALGARIVYPHHYDRPYIARLQNRSARTPADDSVPRGIEAFRKALEGTAIEVRVGRFYPPLP